MFKGEKKPTRVMHLTSVHPRFDTRIFWKQCCSLARSGLDVSLVVADGLGNEVKNDVKIFDVGKMDGRLGRMINAVNRIQRFAVENQVDIYHLHDPELLRIVKKLQKTTAAVVFDSHEDVPNQIMDKPYLGRFTKLAASRLVRLFQNHCCRKLSAIVAATPSISKRFANVNPRTVIVNNFPILSEFSENADWSKKNNEVAYVGGISKIRGAKELINAISLLPGIKLNLAGTCPEKEFYAELVKLPGWKQVNELGHLNRKEVADVLARSVCGLVTILPTVCYKEALPVKMFEYMAAGLPVIASDFPILREIIDKYDCGICVDPHVPKQIANAIDKLVSDKMEASAMGQRGKLAVETAFNWSIEEAKLLDLYRDLIH